VTSRGLEVPNSIFTTETRSPEEKHLDFSVPLCLSGVIALKRF